MPHTVARLRDDQQRRLCNAAFDKISDEFRKGIKPHLEILEEFMERMNAIDSTIRVNGCRATVNALSACPGNPAESNRSNKED